MDLCCGVPDGKKAHGSPLPPPATQELKFYEDVFIWGRAYDAGDVIYVCEECSDYMCSLGDHLDVTIVPLGDLDTEDDPDRWTRSCHCPSCRVYGQDLDVSFWADDGDGYLRCPECGGTDVY
jgi:hypothetical protein